MVEVIGQDRSVAKEITCKGCGAKLRYTKNDIETYHGIDYSGGPDGREWIKCPSCSKDVTIRSW